MTFCLIQVEVVDRTRHVSIAVADLLLHGCEGCACGLCHVLHLRGLDGYEGQCAFDTCLILVDDRLVEIAVLEHVGNNLVVGCAFAGDLSRRADEVVTCGAKLVEVLQTHHVAAVGHDELQVRLIPQDTGQRGDVDPACVIVRHVIIAIIYADGPAAHTLMHLLLLQPATAVTAEHDAVVAVLSGIFLEGIAHHTLHHAGVTGAVLSVAAEDA